jgi:DNA-binding transcriptional LysR family regulator
LLAFFPRVIYTFRNRYPNVHITLRDLSSADQLDALRSRQIDIGIIRKPLSQQPSDMSFTKLLRDGLVVAMHSGHPLGKVAELKIADLKDERFIFYPGHSGVGIYHHFIDLCAKRSFSPKIVQEAQDSSTLIGLAATGLGIAVVPSGLQWINIPDILFKPLVDIDAVTDLVLACRAGEGSPLIVSFRHMAQQALRPPDH